MINATFTKYLKMRLKIPVGSINSLVYFVTNTKKFNITLGKNLRNQMTKIYLPHLESQVMQRHIDEHTNSVTERIKELKSVENISEIPSYLWYNRTFAVPNKPKFRRKLMLDISGWNHREFCSNRKFHVPYLHKKDSSYQYENMRDTTKQKKSCICSICGDKEIGFNHHFFCSGYKEIPKIQICNSLCSYRS